ncbi:23S ribosomal RNA methyltransferase Erm [Streptomyces albipurpureus]|uniref:23S ribosomal RNA methyltransferase Erm n=1 Tax=Streptomyces albipurpureus TaxID=2897419 RepID=A0ABT0UQW4_9ACTN|nr:23S ribosomal RNA methyltransferase Erm [Streptomyces sp. CWNU-1]MCM2390795.1 23S ribosomal RNA methyltransferase Erm [Streptomyces sp. CWNU-1]
MPTHHRHGRHEYGQNFLTDRPTINTLVDRVARTEGPIIEIGTGDGALTLPLQELGRRLTGIEIDDRRAARLARRTNALTTIVHADFLHYRLPVTPYVLVGNLPFHETTPMLRRILRSPGWTDAVLLVQWEVARRRAGVGGATLMTAQWWPWFEFGLVSRVPAAAFRPRPNVDGGVLTITRREPPLLPPAEQKPYQDFAHRVFTGKGRGLPRIIAAAAPELPGQRVAQWVRRQGIGPGQLPKDLIAEQWSDLFSLGNRDAHPGQRSAPPVRRTRRTGRR